MKHSNRWLLGTLLAVALVVALGLIVTWGRGSLAADGVIYVDADATGLNDGSTWDNAFTDLQSALDAAPMAGDQIWVAEGTYEPTVQHGGTGDRYKSFQLKNGVAIYGGFDPTMGATEWEDRDWVTHEAILSGDIGTQGNTADNSYHVFYHPDGLALDGSAILDGFTVTGGNANVAYPHNQGGGMYNDGSSPALINCTFTANRAQYGGTGGGMYNEHSSPVLTNCTFEGNSAFSGGGGMCNNDSSPTLNNCTFLNNGGGSQSGGMYNYDSAPVLTNCTFEGNFAGMGGGMYNSHSSPVLTNCTFEGNSALMAGGMYNESGSSPQLTNCTFEGNSTYQDSEPGGGMFNQQSSPTLINCTFWGNSALAGGGMYNQFSSPTLINCTFEGNSADAGGGMWNYFHSQPNMTNCILWGDSPNEIGNDVESSPVVTYSDIQGGYDGEGNINADPLFADATKGDYHLGNLSPALGAGTSDGAPSTDIEGNPRPDPPGSNPDLGAYENPLPRALRTWHVATTGSDVTGDGSESNPFATIQHGIDVSIDGDTVLVHTGTYTENISFEGKNITVGSLFVLNGDEAYIPQTVIDGNQNSSVVTFMNGEGHAAVLSGLTIVNGYAHEATWPYNDGGGICVVDAAPQLSHLHIISNTAINEGGGIYLGQNQVSEEVARVSNCFINDNAAGSSGGGVRFSSDNGRIAVIESSVIIGNQANRGAGVHIYHSGILENCLIASNTSATSAGGVYVDWGSRGAFITNSTIVDNSAPSFGGLDYVINGATVRNSIIFNNDNGNWNGGSYSHSCTSPLPGGIGNIDADPLFVDAGSGDYHLGPGSPCIDAGDNAAPLPIHDLEGDPRIMDGDLDGIRIVDMGMDEFGHVVYLPLVLRGY